MNKSQFATSFRRKPPNFNQKLTNREKKFNLFFQNIENNLSKSYDLEKIKVALLEKLKITDKYQPINKPEIKSIINDFKQRFYNHEILYETHSTVIEMLNSIENTLLPSLFSVNDTVNLKNEVQYVLYLANRILVVGYSPTGGGHTARTFNIVPNCQIKCTTHHGLRKQT